MSIGPRCCAPLGNYPLMGKSSRYYRYPQMGNLRKRLAKRLRELRGETSQLQFTRKLGLSQSSYNRMEMGQQNVTVDTLEVLCKRLKCDVGDLFAEENEGKA